MDGWRAPSLGIHSAIDKGSMSAKKKDGGSQLQIDLFAVPLNDPPTATATDSRTGGRADRHFTK